MIARMMTNLPSGATYPMVTLWCSMLVMFLNCLKGKEIMRYQPVLQPRAQPLQKLGSLVSVSWNICPYISGIDEL